MKKIFAKFRCFCAETGRMIKKGDPCYYDPAARKVYHPDSDAVRVEESRQETRSTAAMVQTQENAYLDNWSYTKL